MAEVKAGIGKYKGRGVVRDQQGKPKFESAEVVNTFWDVLSDEDRAYLTDKFKIKRK